MNITKIIKSNILIRDSDVVEKIINLCVKKLKFIYKKDELGNWIIIAIKEEKISKSTSIRISHGCVEMYTPDILKRYSGEYVSCSCEKIFPYEDEVFRISPLNFEFENNAYALSNSSKIKTEPHFTNKNKIVLPKHYVVNNLDERALDYKISFSRTTGEVIDKKEIIAYVVSPFEESFFSFKLRKSSIGLYGVTGGLSDIIFRIYRKKLVNFKYESTNLVDGLEYGMMLFKYKE